METFTDSYGQTIGKKYGKWVRVTKDGIVQKVLHASVPYDTYEKLVTFCRTNEVSMAFVLRSLLHQFLNQTQPTLKPDCTIVPRFNESATTTRAE